MTGKELFAWPFVRACFEIVAIILLQKDNYIIIIIINELIIQDQKIVFRCLIGIGDCGGLWRGFSLRINLRGHYRLSRALELLGNN